MWVRVRTWLSFCRTLWPYGYIKLYLKPALYNQSNALRACSELVIGVTPLYCKYMCEERRPYLTHCQVYRPKLDWFFNLFSDVFHCFSWPKNSWTEDWTNVNVFSLCTSVPPSHKDSLLESMSCFPQNISEPCHFMLGFSILCGPLRMVLFDSFLGGYERLMQQKHLQQFLNDRCKSVAGTAVRRQPDCYAPVKQTVKHSVIALWVILSLPWQSQLTFLPWAFNTDAALVLLLRPILCGSV